MRKNPESKWLNKEWVSKYNKEYKRNVLKIPPRKQKEFIERKCRHCNNEFEISKNDKRSVRKRLFCSRGCSFIWHRKKFEGCKTTANGYIMVKVSKHPFANNRGYVYEHRLVMEKKLGRYLTPNEIVHHENKVKDDNNLRLFSSTNQHTIYHLLRGDVNG